MSKLSRLLHRALAVLSGTCTKDGDKPAVKIKVWTTTGKDRHRTRPAIFWQPTTACESAAITIDPTTRYQEILGFGGAFTDAACYVFDQMPSPLRRTLFRELFHPAHMGLSVCRTTIGASDYSASLYSYDEGEPDPELKRFTVAHDWNYILPVLRLARQFNPDLFLIASPWSPPGWMKPNGSMLGGNMQRRYMPAYARYFLKFLQGYKDAGVTVQAVTIQNEVDTDQDSAMPACSWPQEYETDFVANHLGPLFEKEGVSCKILLIDHNYNLWGRAISALETPGVSKYAAGIAWHGYLGDPAWVTRVHDAFPQTEMYWTEATPVLGAPDYETDWTSRSMSFTDALRNWCRSLTVWNLALDENGKPNIGPFGCGGLVTINSSNHTVRRSGMYHALAHYSRHIKRGAVRIGSHGGPAPCSYAQRTRHGIVHNEVEDGPAGVSHIAFENPDGEKVLVLTNGGKARKVTLQIGAESTSIRLERDSVTTLVWR
jgi:glucosylceramidase